MLYGNLDLEWKVVQRSLIVSEQYFTWNIAVIALTLSSFTLMRIIRRTKIHVAHKILVIWLLTMLAPFISTLLDLTLDPETFSLFPWLNPALSLLYGPLLFAYVQQLVKPPRQFQIVHVIHLLPFIGFYLLFIFSEPISPIFPNPSAEAAAFTTNAESNLTQVLFRYFGECNLIISVGYSLATLYLLRQHRQKISSYFSQRDVNVSLLWIHSIPALFCLLVLLNVANEWIHIPLFSPEYAHLSSYLLFIAVLCFFGVEQEPLFYEVEYDKSEAETKNVVMDSNDGVTFEPSTLMEIETLMVNEKPYLDSDFTVYQLANHLGMPRRRLSYLLNKGFNKNFFQFVNQYRVDEVKSRLRNTEYARFTLLDIALESGFKSKSSFNSIFKQYTGETPSQYRKRRD